MQVLVRVGFDYYVYGWKIYIMRECLVF